MVAPRRRLFTTPTGSCWSTPMSPPCPASSVALSSCNSSSQTLSATVTTDPDPAVAPKAIHFRLDDGGEETAITTGNPGKATIVAPGGSHTLEYWGEDTAGGLEDPHHTATISPRSGAPGRTRPARSPR